MTTIGTAVLQVIPSLLGVTEAIEKQLGGTVIKVKVEPDTDTRTTQRAGKQIGTDIGKGIEDGLRSGPSFGGASGDGSIIGDIIQGKPVSGKVRTAAKKVGKEVSTGIDEGMSEAGARGKGKIGQSLFGSDVKQSGVAIGKELAINIGDVLKDYGKEAAKAGGAVGKEYVKKIGDEIASGHVDKAFKDVGDTVKRTTGIIDTLGGKVGLNLDGVSKWGTDTASTLERYGSNIQGVVDKVKNVTGIGNQIRAGIQSKDASATIAGLQGALTVVEPLAKNLGVDLSQTSGALNQIDSAIKSFTSSKSDVKDTADQLKGLLGGTRAGKVAGAAGELAGPIAGAFAFEQYAPGFHQMTTNLQAQVQGKKPFDPKEWFQSSMLSAGGPGAAITSGMDLVPKEYGWLQQQLAQHGPSWLPKLPDLPPELGGPKPAPKLLHGPELKGEPGTYGDLGGGKRAYSWWAPGTPAVGQQQAPSGGNAAISAAQAVVQSAAAAINVGSATISGLSVNVPGGAGASSTPTPYTGSTAVRQGFKSWYDDGGYTGNVPIDQIAGVVHGKEFVVNASAQQRLENDHPGLLDYMNSNGELPMSPIAAAAAPAGGGASIPSMAGRGGGGSAGSDLGLFTNAAESAVTGQMAALTGVSSTPGWLNAATTFLGGLSISGPGGKIFGGGSFGLEGLFSHVGSGAPIAAAPSSWPQGSGAAGIRDTKQASGPQVTYNIAARDTEDAFVRAQRQERERAAAKLDRYS